MGCILTLMNTTHTTDQKDQNMNNHQSYTFDGFSSDSIRQGHDINLHNTLVNRLAIVWAEWDATPRSSNPKRVDSLKWQMSELVKAIHASQEHINALLIDAGHKIISDDQNEHHIMAQFSNESGQLVRLTNFI